MGEIPYRRIRRPAEDATPTEMTAYRKAFADGFADLGIGPEEELILISAADFQTQASLEDLDNELGPFAKNSETSRKAAVANYDKTNDQHKAILKALYLRRGGSDPGLTRQQLAELTPVEPDAVRPRVLALVEGKMLEVTDRTRDTRAGNPAEIIDITQHGREEWEAHADDE